MTSLFHHEGRWHGVPESSRSAVFRTTRILATVLAASVLAGCASVSHNRQALSASPIVRGLDAGRILEQAGVEDVTDALIVALTPTQERVILTGCRAGKHVVVVAYRHPYSDEHPWRVSSAQFKLTDRCLWVRGERDYDFPPTRSDIDKLLREIFLSGPPKDLVFIGDRK